jgi:hypothetical protein
MTACCPKLWCSSSRRSTARVSSNLDLRPGEAAAIEAPIPPDARVMIAVRPDSRHRAEHRDVGGHGRHGMASMPGGGHALPWRLPVVRAPGASIPPLPAPRIVETPSVDPDAIGRSGKAAGPSQPRSGKPTPGRRARFLRILSYAGGRTPPMSRHPPHGGFVHATPPLVHLALGRMPDADTEMPWRPKPTGRQVGNMP